MGFMYITGGEKKGHKIFTRSGDLSTRPTPSIMREALFNMIDVRDKLFMDGFSGFGTVGLEALSRGAKSVVFVEMDKKNIEIIKRNLVKLSLLEKSIVIRKDILLSIEQLKGREPFDYIFLGPPYKNLNILKSLVPKIFEILKKGGDLILQYPKNEELYDFSKFDIMLVNEKKYGSNRLLFYRIKGR